MPEKLQVMLNGIKIYEYDKNTRHPGKKREFLDSMDIDMDEGLELNGDFISSPDKMQRAQYVAMSLLLGINIKNDGLVSVACGYLVTRLPELKQIQAIEENDKIAMDLIFDD